MKRLALCCIVLLMLALVSCSVSSSTNPVNPQLPENEGINTQSGQVFQQGHNLLGMYKVVIDTQALEIYAIPLRTTAWHLNAVKFLEPAGSGSLLSFSALQVAGPQIGVDVSIRHPFDYMDWYSGFDVKGIVLGSADYVDPVSPDTRTWAGGEEGLRLLNADGWTRWWNPSDFPSNGTVFSFESGYFSTSHDAATLDAKLCGYKVFASALSPNADLTHLVAYPFSHYNGRAVFHSGEIRTRHYEIAFPADGSGGPELTFNYAVDASHGFPPDYVPGEDIESPDDFPPDANQAEPFVIDVQVPLNSVYYTTEGCVGGLLELQIRIADWQALLNNTSISSEVLSIEVTSPQLFIGRRYPELVADWTPGAPWATYRLLLEGVSADSVLGQQLLVTLVSASGDYQEDVSSYHGTEPLASYYVVPIMVSQTPAVGQPDFDLNPTSPWPKPGGNIHNTNCVDTLGPQDPSVAWTIDDIDSETMPVVDSEGRIYAARYVAGGLSLLMFDSDGRQVADLFLADFVPDGNPMMVGCSLLWCSEDGEVVRVYQDGNKLMFYTPGMGASSLGMLNIDHNGLGYVHGLSSIHAFNKFGQYQWARYAVSDQCMFIGPTAITADGMIVIGKINLSNAKFEFWGLDQDDGEVRMTHSPDSAEGAPFGCAADPLTGNLYYAIGNKVVGVSIDDGVSWSYKGTNYFLQNIAVAPDGTVYAAESALGSSGGVSKIVSLTPDLDKKWSFSFNSGITAGPITDEFGFVYFCDNDGKVRCYSPTGSLDWVIDVDGFPAYITFGPDNSLLVGLTMTMDESRLVCLRD